VIPLVANTKKGLMELKLAMSRPDLPAPKPFLEAIPVTIRGAVARCRESLIHAKVVSEQASLLEPLYLVSDHDPTHYGIAAPHLVEIAKAREQLEREVPHWEDTLVGSRYEVIHQVCDGVITHAKDEKRTFTDRLDAVVLHRVWGWVSLAAILIALLYFIFSVAEAPMNWIESLFASLSEKFTGTTDPATGAELAGWMAPGDLRDLIVDGALAGVQGVIIFLPQILILFFFIGLMEDTGYMARIAFIMDRLMGKVGLNGKSFLPIMSSYACAVPGVMAARTIDNPKDRLITILVAPLASCSARLPVYFLMIAVLFPSSQVSVLQKSLILASMYAVGTIGALFFAWLFKSKLLPGKPAPLILELPSYKRPSLVNVFQQMKTRAWIFIRRAGTVILGLSILLWAASTYPKSEGTKSEQLANSYAGKIGHAIEPVIKPLGYDWKIGIGLVASFAAREVFVTTMSTIYSIEEEEDEEQEKLREQLNSARWPDGRIVYTPAVCIGLMVFYVFAMQCLSTVAVVRRETNSWKWPIFQIVYMTGAAYVLALLVYQVGSRIGY
jgi:ferrous iron transport protein B